MQVTVDLLRIGCDIVHADGRVHFRENYSGRGMYGHECVGLVGNFRDCMRVISYAIHELTKALVTLSKENDPILLMSAEEDFVASIDMLLEFQQDAMGLDTILYWPRLNVRHTAPAPLNTDLGELDTKG